MFNQTVIRILSENSDFFTFAVLSNGSFKVDVRGLHGKQNLPPDEQPTDLEIMNRMTSLCAELASAGIRNLNLRLSQKKPKGGWRSWPHIFINEMVPSNDIQGSAQYRKNQAILEELADQFFVEEDEMELQQES